MTHVVTAVPSLLRPLVLAHLRPLVRRTYRHCSFGIGVVRGSKWLLSCSCDGRKRLLLWRVAVLVACRGLAHAVVAQVAAAHVASSLIGRSCRLFSHRPLMSPRMREASRLMPAFQKLRAACCLFSHRSHSLCVAACVCVFVHSCVLTSQVKHVM